jgi:SAM-dependent methyltransferase
MAHGWLPRNDALSWTVRGIPVDPATRTRREEYHFVANVLDTAEPPTQVLVDAATGYVPTWHMMPYVAHNMGIIVHTIDADPRTLDLPATPNGSRRIGDICALPWPDAAFDAALCISTLEHMETLAQRQAAEELVRVTRPGGLVIVTADAAPWLPALFGELPLDIGDPWPTPPAGAHLSPTVYALWGIRR